MFDIQHEINSDTLILKPVGRLDGTTVASFENTTLSLIKAEHPTVILDMSGVDYLSSAGLRSLLIIAKQIKSIGGSASLCELRGNVAEVIAVSGFDTIFRIFANITQAKRIDDLS